MMRARPRTAVQDVWQHVARANMPSWVRACTQWQDDAELYLIRGADKQLIEYCDWLIRDLNGAPAWSTDEDFRRQYEVVP